MHKIEFADPRATEIPPGEIVNTFRVGRKWFDALRVGDMVELAITGAAKPFARAVVLGADFGEYGQVEQFAVDNYRWRNCAVFTARRELLRELGQAYPDWAPQGDRDENGVAVITFMRTSDPVA